MSGVSAIGTLAASFAQRPQANYATMFPSIGDATDESAIAPPAPKTWGSFRLAAWAWAGAGDVGPVVIQTPIHAYAKAYSRVVFAPRDITVI
jgi:hypothetical protein